MLPGRLHLVAAWLVGAARLQSITIDWAGASGEQTPHIANLGEVRYDTDNDKSEADANSWEDAWWRGGFGDDTQEHWFGASPEPRGPRPVSMVQLGHRVGTVYTHVLTGAIGVIIGWDARTRAPKQWLGPNLPGERSWAERLRRLHAPHYSVLEEVKRPDGSSAFQQRYIVAHCTEKGEDGPPCLQVELPARRMRHPSIDLYFKGFNGEQGYLPKQALSRLYPDG